ncbi:retrovirus-related pol polyprotein from transposon TNT 1-94, partial [Tanacetum coccineum]
SKKKPHKPKSKDTNQEKLYLLHMDLRGPIRTESVNGKNYILGSKDEAPDFIIKFLKMIQKVSISHETSIARTPQQNGVVERRNYTLIEAGRTMLIYAKAPLFLWAEAVATALLSATQPMTARTWESYNQRLILQSSSEPALHEMTPATISSGLVPNPPPSTPFVPPIRTERDYLFQPLFDELLNPPPSVDAPVPKVIAPIPKVVAPAPDVLTGSPSLITIDQDAPSVIPIPESNSDASSSLEVIPMVMHSDIPAHEHISKWSKDHSLENIVGELDRSVSTRLQLHEQALLCYFDAFLIAVEPKTYKDALPQSCWIEATQEELNEFQRLKV